MEVLPAEILEEISWLALNPEFYLVSKTISSRLPSLRMFEQDLILLLFCERTEPEAAWGDIDPFPWQTTQAGKYDYKLSHGERSELQRIVLNQSWFTLRKFKFAATSLCRFWVEKNWKTADMTEQDRRFLQHYLNTDFVTAKDPRQDFLDVHGNHFIFWRYSVMSIWERDIIHLRTYSVVEVLYIPEKLFLGPRSSSKLDFFILFRRFTEKRLTPLYPVSYPVSALREALFSALLDEDEDWLMALLGTVVAPFVDLPRDQLIYELYSAAIRERKWKMLSHITEGIRLPEDFLEATLAPAIMQAISAGDRVASELLQWIEKEGWEKIQLREYAKNW